MSGIVENVLEVGYIFNTRTLSDKNEKVLIVSQSHAVESGEQILRFTLKIASFTPFQSSRTDPL